MIPVRVLVADPPWGPDDHLPGAGRGAAKHYGTMTLDEICNCLSSFEVAPERNAILFLWRLASMPDEALAVVRSWGFVPKSEIVWEKKTKHGKDHFGMGRFVRAAHETCPIAERGRCKPAHKSQRSRFAAPVPTNAQGRAIHSAKPDAFYEIVREMYPEGPRVELFSRRHRQGFICLGNEVGKLDVVEAP